MCFQWVQVLELDFGLQVQLVELSVPVFADMALVKLRTRFFFGLARLLLVFLQFLFVYGLLFNDTLAIYI